MKIAAVVAVVVSILLLATLVVASLMMRPGAQITTPTPMPTAEPDPALPAKDVPEEAESPPWTVLEPDDQPLTAETLPGTDWHAGPYTLSFHDDGLVAVNRRFSGNWRLVGDALIVEAQGQTLRGTLSGSHLTFEGREAERVAFLESYQESRPGVPVR